MRKPRWLDEAIQTVIDKGDPKLIAQIVANSSKVTDAIKRGLAKKPKPGVMGPSHAQIIADEITAAMTAE